MSHLLNSLYAKLAAQKPALTSPCFCLFCFVSFFTVMTSSRCLTARGKLWWSERPMWLWSVAAFWPASGSTSPSWYGPSCWGASTRTWPTALVNTWRSTVSSSSVNMYPQRWAWTQPAVCDLAYWSRSMPTCSGNSCNLYCCQVMCLISQH